METPTTLGDNPYEPPRANPEVVEGPAASYRSGSDLGSMTNRMIEELQRTRPWIRLITGLSFFISITVGFTAVSLFFGVSEPSGVTRRISALTALFYVVIAVCYGLFASRLWSYSRSIGELVSSRRALAMEKALAAQRRFWASVGGLTLLLAVLGVLLIVVSISWL